VDFIALIEIVHLERAKKNQRLVTNAGQLSQRGVTYNCIATEKNDKSGKQ